MRRIIPSDGAGEVLESASAVSRLLLTDSSFVFSALSIGLSVTLDGAKSMSLKIFRLKGHMPLQENQDIIFDGVAADGSAVFAINGKS